MVLLTFGIAFAGTVLALALAFGLGGKDLAREILESRLRRHGARTTTKCSPMIWHAVRRRYGQRPSDDGG